MLLSTKTSLYHLYEDGSKAPESIYTSSDLRRVQEGDKRNVIALGDGRIIVQGSGEQKILDSGIKERIDSILVVKEDPLILLIGCTPPNLYRLVDNENNAQLISTFQELSVRDQWYTPWGGPAAVRSMDKTKDGWVYANIHVGSIMRSPDQGESWEPVEPTLHKDVHEVAASPINPERVYANTYLSVYVSDDRGETWSHRSGALRGRYGRGIAVHPTEPDVLLCGVSDGPSGGNVNGQLYWSENAGRNWVHVVDGFPDSTRRNIDTFHIKFAGGFAWVSDDNTLYLSLDKGRSFELFWYAPEEITVISAT
ncbi:WD40/YVTN/BNR-like repeat-containing protein [Thermoproteota archaeon]